MALTCRRLLIVVLIVVLATPAEARTLLSSICHVKGQEENLLHGWGLVVGLKGTGDSSEYAPMITQLATALARMGARVGGEQGKLDLRELKETKNVALVHVTAVVPAAGARQGDKLHCKVSSIGSSKSLVGGRLFSTPLSGPTAAPMESVRSLAHAPAIGQTRVYAFAYGDVRVEDAKISPTTGVIDEGCQLEEDFYHPFVKETKDGKLITLVLDRDHASFQTAQTITETINTFLRVEASDDRSARPARTARAVNAVNIEIPIPDKYGDEVVFFVSMILQTTAPDLSMKEGRVVINEKKGTIAIDGDIEIGPVVVTHKNIQIDTEQPQQQARFLPLEHDQAAGAKLKALVDALNAVKVPPEDMVDILRNLKRTGKLHGTLIFE